MTARISLCIVGYGYWGPKLVRNFLGLKECRNIVVCDSMETRRFQAVADFPSVQVTADFASVLANPAIAAVVIATPVTTHFPLAKAALLAGKHVLVEKPLATTAEHAEELVALAARQGLSLMVDHTFVYHSVVARIKTLLDESHLGKLRYIDSTRINLGLFQHDVNVIWDLAVHDVSIVHHLVPERPVSVQAIGASHVANGLENIGFLVLRYASGLIVHSNCSWISPVKIRHMLFGGDKRMILYNDLDTEEPIKIYDSGFEARSDDERSQLLFDYRVGDIHSPKIVIAEALQSMARDFVRSIHAQRPAISNGAFGLEIVKVLAAAERSIRSNGTEIRLA
ncbi:Gfo/Idh/MocA family oxidoreductase [Opitutus sp. GAS368]|uniref:Gfo/Idh/MocA family protein n=1 Tax=Opitutus sp. GAS368 TaxID=1882749 RepID=UPI00087C27DA|nr:Gfo/Idh/MocA family oxidoreductase [Opitutus sp. GAS368]SDS27060.1 Predicted dehydrogenase [Opitutus sp. GAS368]